MDCFCTEIYDTEQLRFDIRSMEKRFTILVLATRESIRERNVPLECLVGHLSAYRTFPAVMKNEDKLLANCREDLENANNTNKVFSIILPFLSFLDFEILEDIINNKDLGADSDRQYLVEYILTLEEFLNSWRVDPQKISHDESELTRSQAKLCFVLTTELLSMYRDVKVPIARVLGVRVHAVQLVSIEDMWIDSGRLRL